jgi:hypothetical protein
MDATQARRTRDGARRAWYAAHRRWRFARFLGFVAPPRAAAVADRAARAPGA